jgi:hypothetical protein
MSDPYDQVLRRLHHAGLPFALIGSYALSRYYPVEMAGYALPDCDAVLLPEALPDAVALLLEMDWALSIWERPVTGPVTAIEAAGKFYLRARQGPATLDLTYECPLPLPSLLAARRIHHGLPLADLADIVALKQLKGRPADLALLDRLSHAQPIEISDASRNA